MMGSLPTQPPQIYKPASMRLHDFSKSFGLQLNAQKMQAIISIPTPQPALSPTMHTNIASLVLALPTKNDNAFHNMPTML